MYIKNMKSAAGNTIANQFVIESDNKTVFQSYESPIVTIDYKKMVIIVHPAWDYSKTTGKYRNLFMIERGFDSMGNKAGFVNAMKTGICNGFSIVMAN